MKIVFGVTVVVCLFVAGYHFFLSNPQIMPEKTTCCGSPVISNTLNGKKVFLKNCASCHGINAGGTGIAPKLRGRNLTKKYIKTVVSKGKGKMRALPHLSKKKLEALSSFISSLK